jgi:flagellar motor component MotA
MNHDEFVRQYTDIVKKALHTSCKARREGLLLLEDELDQEMVDARDIFEYGIRFVVDGYDKEIIDKILSNIIKQEKDEQVQLLKTIQKAAVLIIDSNPRILYAVLNSHTGISIKEDEIKPDDI